MSRCPCRRTRARRRRWEDSPAKSAAASRYGSCPTGDPVRPLREQVSRAEARTALELGERYPGDAGVPAALLLNRLSLQPGEAVYLPAGNLHTYLQGVAG